MKILNPTPIPDRVPLPEDINGIYYPFKFAKLEMEENGMWKLHIDQSQWPKKIRSVYSIALIPSVSGYDDQVRKLLDQWKSPQKQLLLDEDSIQEEYEKIVNAWELKLRTPIEVINDSTLPLVFTAQTLKYDRMNLRTNKMIFRVDQDAAIKLASLWDKFPYLSMVLVGEESKDWTPGSNNEGFDVTD